MAGLSSGANPFPLPQPIRSVESCPWSRIWVHTWMKNWESQNPNPSTVFGSCYPHAFEHGFSNMRPSTGVNAQERFSLHDQEVFGRGLYASTRLPSLLQWNPFAMIQLGLDQKSPVFRSQHTHTHVRSTLESDSNIREFLLLMLRLYTQKLLSNYGEV